MEDRFHSNVTTGEGQGNSLGPKCKFVPITSNIPNIMRIVDPEGFAKYYESWIVCDDGTKRPFIVGLDHAKEGKSYNALMEIIGDADRWCKGGILESIKDSVTGKQKFIWESKAPEIFLKVRYNGDPTGNEGSWKPKPQYVFNVIARAGEQNSETGAYEFYSQLNKKTQVLKSGQMLFNALVTVADNNGELDTYDVNVYKTGSGKTDTQYTAYKAEKSKYPLTVVGGLSQEEQSYECWDFAKEFAPTSAADILNYLEKSIAEADRVLGKNIISKLYSEAGKTQDPTIAPSVQTQQAQTQVRSVAPAQASVAATVTAQAPVRSVAPARVIETAPVVPQSTGYSCHNCQTAITSDTEYCPSCSTQVGGPCQQCGKIFSIYDSKCPHCGKDYGTTI